MTDDIRQHVPVLEWRNDINCWLLICRVCHEVLWDGANDNDECHPEPPPLGINVRDGVGTKDKFGG